MDRQTTSLVQYDAKVIWTFIYECLQIDTNNVNKTPTCPRTDFLNLNQRNTDSPSPLRIVLMGASWCQVFVSGWYFSAVFQRFCPSYPPTTYKAPPHAATPAPRRATDIGQTNDQRLDSGSHLQTTVELVDGPELIVCTTSADNTQWHYILVN